MVMVAHATFPNSSGPILLLVVLSAIAKRVIQGTGVA
jgi:hypothetical protein